MLRFGLVLSLSLGLDAGLGLDLDWLGPCFHFEKISLSEVLPGT